MAGDAVINRDGRRTQRSSHLLLHVRQRRTGHGGHAGCHADTGVLLLGVRDDVARRGEAGCHVREGAMHSDGSRRWSCRDL